MKTRFAHVLALLIFTLTAIEVRAADIAVVMSSDAEVYQEALEGFREAARHRIVGVQNLRNNPAGGRDELIKLRASTKPDLIFAIGTPALQLVAREITDMPVVHAMVFNPAAIDPVAGKNSTGITMTPAAEQALSLVKELNPKYRRIGAIFDPSKSAHLLAPARQAAQKAGLQLVTKEVRSPGEITGALNLLRNEIDLLYLLPDETIIADEILQRIFLFSFDSKIPVLGFSERHTQTGALLSLAHGSVKDMGRQAAQLANMLIMEKKLALPAHITPRETKLTVNLKTAHKLAVDLPGNIVNRADNAVKAPVYKEGDWWIFRTKILRHNAPPLVQDHRVEYRNGKFESDDPGFLTGGDTSFRPIFFPFGSLYSTDPQRNWLNFPLLPGKTWSYRFTRINFGDNRSHVGHGRATAEVTGNTPQIVDSQAGRFPAIEIQRQDSPMISEGGLGIPYTLTYFYSPEAKSIIKSTARITERYAVGYQFELELIAYGNDGDRKVAGAPVQREARPPTAAAEKTAFGNVVNAPVYKEGDWWIFRTTILSESQPTKIQDHRVIFKNGKFESDDPNFLSGGDTPARPVFFPFPSVYLTDPQKKWLDFPLVPGKTWSYQFLRTRFGRGTSNAPTFAYATASAEVMGQTPQMVQTAAGQFRAIEIQRSDSGVSGAAAKLTYYYSPQTKSIIKSTAYTRYRYSIGYQFDLELIAYGNESEGKAASASVQREARAPTAAPEKTTFGNVVNAPVYKEGDWWIFRTTILSATQPTQIREYRVVYRNGNFECDDPNFLSGGETPIRPHFLPFASLYFTDPQRKWLDFPLSPGKTWRFQFRRTYSVAGGTGGQRFTNGTAIAEVVEQFPQTVQTTAGQFLAIQIQRQDSALPGGFTNEPMPLTYYYSPQTKSVIKSTAYTRYRYSIGYQFDLELVAYGNDADSK